MKPYHVIKAPHKFLATKAAPVAAKEFGTERLKEKTARMMITMMRENGVGLAGNQVGIMQCIIVVNVNQPEADGPSFRGALINPEIVALGDARESKAEGCLSFPGETSIVDRHLTLTVKYFTTDGEEVIKTFEGLTARCVQHEIDHLHGVTMKDVEG